MNVTVPLFVNSWVTQAIIGTQVDNFATGVKQLRHGFHAGRMRQCAEDNVGAFSDFLGG